MKKIIIPIIIAMLPLFSGCSINQSNNNELNYSASRTGTTDNTQEDSSASSPIETPLYEFSTPIKSQSSNRLNNIKLTCQSLDGTVVENESEFSFCNTVGQASSGRGFKKADVIVNNKVVQAVGGGMCQVSTTLYNAVLGIQELEVTERHEHARPVNYVESGKDATISYGTLDLKFKNHTGSAIKIYANADDGNVNVKIVSIS